MGLKEGDSSFLPVYILFGVLFFIGVIFIIIVTANFLKDKCCRGCCCVSSTVGDNETATPVRQSFVLRYFSSNKFCDVSNERLSRLMEELMPPTHTPCWRTTCIWSSRQSTHWAWTRLPRGQGRPRYQRESRLSV